MTLSTIKNIKSREGFTLVELLIVIVVIAILAAITIVAYNGVQNKAHTTAANSAATEVLKKAALYQTEFNSYPASIAALQTAVTTGTGIPGASNPFTTSDPAYLASGDATASTSADLGAATPVAPAKDNTVLYTLCSTTGAKVQYWNYGGSPAALSAALTTGTGC